jgi:hypothetical protein
MRLPLESKFTKNTQKEIDLIINGNDFISNVNNRKHLFFLNFLTDKGKKPFINQKLNIKNGEKSIETEFEKDKHSIDMAISNYLENLHEENIESFNTPSASKKLAFKLPKIKLINYKMKKPQKKRSITEEEKKPNIRKLLPYSRLGKHCNFKPEFEENSLNDLSQKNFPFITGTQISNNNDNNKEENYQSTLNVVYNSANKEFLLKNNFDKKRKRLELMLGMKNIPELNTYDDILFKKFETIKNKRHQKAKKINESQRLALLSARDKINIILDNDMELLDKLEDKLYSKSKEN